MTMHCWYFDKKELRNTPSAADGIDYDTELRYRREGARFIIDTGTKMDLGCNTIATGVVYFHRFYMFHSFRNFPRYVTASCCLFLAGKVEETPKKCRDIIRSAKLSLPDSKFATFGDDPKEEVMTLERILLQTIKFDLQVDHPYHFLVKYAKCLKGDKTKLQKMVQMAWTFVNDSLCTTLCLQWEPEIIAVALMYLAGKLSKFEALDWTGRQPKHLRWWDMFIEDVTMDLLEDICHQVLDLYSQPQTANQPDSPPPPPPPKSKPDPPPPPMETSVIPTIVNAHPIQSVVPPVKMLMKPVPPMKAHQAIEIPKLPIDTLKPPPPIPMETFQYPPPYPPGPPPAAVPLYPPPGPYPPPPPPTAAFPPPFYPPPPV